MIYQNKKFIVLSSITYAYKARDLLNSKGIKCYIERIPEHLRNTGCGYGIKVNNDAEAAVNILREAGIKVKNVLELQ